MNKSDYMAAIDAANHKQLLTAHQAVVQERDAMKIEIDRLQKNLSSKTEIANQLKDNLASSFEAQAALRAQIEALRVELDSVLNCGDWYSSALEIDRSFDLGGDEIAQRIINTLKKTPAQCLAEIKAQVVEEFANWACGECNDSNELWLDGKANQYANQLRQAAKDQQ